MNNPIKPRRSVLYMPGSNGRALQKARTLPADALIFDLEDAVAQQSKTAARTAVLNAISAGGYGYRELVIRVNAPDTPWHEDDLNAVAGSQANAVLLPKVNGPEDVASAGRALRVAGAATDLGLWVMAETPDAIRQVDLIATAEPALQAIVMGNNDLAKALRLPADPARTGLLHAMGAAILAARAQGLDILDGAYGDLADQAGFTRECAQGKSLGFDGKTLIHPAQIAPANEIFGVTDEDVRRAEAIVAAWQAADAAGQGVAVADGQMIEALHAESAQRVLALHAAINARSED
ncbi:MAG: CoA ester lyase [Chromatiales bacterium]|nr:MAG: CoA ester lyase [Chromatiales bacterium]